jgi:outer membrane protein assembly factor BamB
VALDGHGDRGDRGDRGDIAWRADPGDDITEVSAGLADDGTVLLGTNGANEWAYRPDGTPKWQAPRIITYSSPPVTGSGLAYVGGHSGTVHVFRIDDGARVAEYRAPGAQIWSSTILDRNYRGYLGTQSGHALGLDPKGAVVFDVDLGAPVDSYPALTADGGLIIGTRNATLTAIG